MRGYRFFFCFNRICPIVEFKEWANDTNSPSQEHCPHCGHQCHPNGREEKE